MKYFTSYPLLVPFGVVFARVRQCVTSSRPSPCKFPTTSETEESRRKLLQLFLIGVTRVVAMDLPSIITASPDGYVSSSDSHCPDKDSDAIKLFVGQVPKTFEEKDLKPYLVPFGSIHELSILRDKLNMAHKGIVFIYKAGRAYGSRTDMFSGEGSNWVVTSCLHSSQLLIVGVGGLGNDFVQELYRTNLACRTFQDC